MKFTLKDYQEQAVDDVLSNLRRARENFKNPQKREISSFSLTATTGAGKTVLAAAIVTGALAKGKKVLFTVPFLSLVDQTVQRFAEQGIDAVGVMQGFHPGTDASQPVQVASLQTLRRRLLPQADIALVDEAHRWSEFYADWFGRPEWPKPPAPRRLASKDSTISSSTCTTGTTTICAMRSPGCTVKRSRARFQHDTITWPW